MKVKLQFFIIPLLILKTSVISNLYAQGAYGSVRYDSIPFFHNNDSLLNPFTGGFNNPQFSLGDLNGDGKKDLFVFDRSGNKPMVFINEGSPGNPKYVFKHQFMSYFPSPSQYSPYIESWALIRDFNCDGIGDLFASAPGGIMVFRNDGIAYPQFTSVTGLLLSNYQPNNLNIYVISADIPGIDDVDKDGDLDILTFDVLGSRLEYHRNYSVENIGSCDTLWYVLKNKCWGHFTENSFNNSINLFDTCNYNVASPQRTGQGNKHAGSTVCIIETNNNDARDLVLGDISFPNLTLLTNCATIPNINSSMCSTDTAFPKNHTNTVASGVRNFPAAFWLDVNDDGKRDLLVAPNAAGTLVSDNYYNVWYYQNNGSDLNPSYNLVSKRFLAETAVDVGEGANVAMADIDQDGLLDLFIGNFAYYDSIGGMIAFYKNIGTQTAPIFKLITHNFANLPSYNLNTTLNLPAKGIAPTFGDLDGDGDVDMIVGDSEGKVHLFTNNGNGNFSLAQANLSSIDVGEYAAPQLFDLNGDGLLDLIIGEKDGNLNYYENTGTASSPVFTLITQNLGNVQVKKWWDYQGYSYPFFFRHGQDIRLLCGSKSGYIYYYDSIQNNLNGSFHPVDTMFMDIWEGIRATVAGGFFMGNDTLVDFFVGTYNGGVAPFKGTGYIAPSSVDIYSLPVDAEIYPVPASDHFLVRIREAYLRLSDLTIIIYNLAGQIVGSYPYSMNPVDVNHLPGGFYLVKLEWKGKKLNYTGKLTIIR